MIESTLGAALDKLNEAGHKPAFIGEANILNSFLAEGLGHDLIILVAPAIGGRESLVVLTEGQHETLQLLSVKELGSGVIKMLYRFESGSD